LAKRRSEGFLAQDARTIKTVVQADALIGTTMRRGDAHFFQIRTMMTRRTT